MSVWGKADEIEGVREIHLTWALLAWLILKILGPLFAALYFSSFTVKSACRFISFLSYVRNLPIYGPCITALAVIGLPWYIFFEWDASPDWLVFIPILIGSIELSYIRHRMRFVSRTREEQKNAW